ncbi:MAG: serine/threonine-protein kinase [Ruminococcus sp.]|uniref:serine/threonine protein kinase n=1 Tax=Ruminococcus sp. TaxID=41978 RepID=UPI0025F67444|nr:serine/threonine-protein kinase [Ruminococcus sp.]MCR5599577.1 serine/threonine-protein kinase [Ruminococcus sp.]
MAELKVGYKGRTIYNSTFTILEFLGGGGQGNVYRVECGGKEMALKWYHKSTIDKMKNPQEFYENLRANIKKGAPTKAFLWPEELSNWIDGSFGYIMPLRPKGYDELTRFLLWDPKQRKMKASFANITARCNAAINIIEGFRALHNDGYSYQDLNNGNFFINPENGDVLICDNDNVSERGVNFGIAGKQRYMAPEVVLGGSPDKRSDRFSLAVILFRMLFIEHPLEGKYSTPPCMTPELEKKFYGSDPVFVLDPEDDRNAANTQLNTNTLRFWKIYPDYIRDLFTQSFGKSSVQPPYDRIIELTWLDAFIKLRSETVPCPHCGKETFITPKYTVSCMYCGDHLTCTDSIKFKRFELPAFGGAKLYEGMTGDTDGDFHKIIGEVVRNKKDPSKHALRNLSDQTWSVKLPDNSVRNVEPNGIMPINRGFVLTIGKSEGIVE